MLQGAVMVPADVAAWCVAYAEGVEANELITPMGTSNARNVLPRIKEATMPTSTASWQK